MKKNAINFQGFSLLEFVIVIVILGLISTLTTSSIIHIKANNRDAKRVSDILEIQTALEMYYRVHHQYPVTLTPGQPLEKDGVIYMSRVPSNPQPVDGDDCPSEATTYDYAPSHDARSYTINFCLSGRTGDVGAGINTAIPGDITTCIPNCVKSCNTGRDGCGGTCAVIIECLVDVEVCSSSDHCILITPE